MNDIDFESEYPVHIDDNGPTDAQIEEQEIDDLIEFQEMVARGEL